MAEADASAFTETSARLARQDVGLNKGHAMRTLAISLLWIMGLTMSPTTVIGAPIAHSLPGTPGEGAAWRPSLMLWEQPPKSGDRSRPVLYLHGSTFPSALSILFALEGRSWADGLNDAGYNVFGLDFAGYGGSERYEGSDPAPPRGRTIETVDQVERAVRFILRETGAQRVSIIAHSWGTMSAGRFAGKHPELVEKLVFFGPVAQRQGPRSDVVVPPHLDVTVEAQHARFVGSVPAGQAPVLIEGDFPRWASAYLDSDDASRTRTPASVRVPSGPQVDLAEAWSGQLPYDPSRISAPTLIVRGAWDPITQDADAAWLKGALSRSPLVQDVVVPRATHLMHLERGRFELHAATEAFLASASNSAATALSSRPSFSARPAAAGRP